MKLQIILVVAVLLFGLLTFAACDRYFCESKVIIENRSGKDLTEITLASQSASGLIQYPTVGLLRNGQLRQITLRGMRGEGSLILHYKIDGQRHDWNGWYIEPRGYKMNAIIQSDGTLQPF